MTQGELEKIPAEVEKAFSDLESRIMSDVVYRIKKNGFSTATSNWEISRLQQLGESEENIKKWIQETLNIADEELARIFSDEVYEQYYGHAKAYAFCGAEQIPYEKNRELQQFVAAVKAQTSDTCQNITASMGFAIQNPASGSTYYTPLEQFYRETLDQAMYGIESGAFSYQSVLEKTIHTMTKSGIRWVDYNSGYHSRVNVAARRALMTGFRQIQGKINEQVAVDLGTDTYEVTYHVGARPSHQVWQGKVWTKQQLIDVCGLGTVAGLHGANCYHDYNAFVMGASVRTYTDEQLQQMMEEENAPKLYNGKEYTTYEALQQQRRMETAMRKTRQDIKLLQEGAADEQTVMLKKARYQGQMQSYKDFSTKMGLPEQMKRVYQDGLQGKFVNENIREKILAAKEMTVEEIKKRVAENNARISTLTTEYSQKQQALENALLFGNEDVDTLNRMSQEVQAVKAYLDDMIAKTDVLKSKLPQEGVQTVQSVVIEGKNIIGNIDYTSSDIVKFDHVIEKSIHAQGFDGNPSVVEYDDFKKAMEESGFYAERTYSARTISFKIKCDKRY